MSSKFVRTREKYHMLNVVDEFTHLAIAILVKRKLNSLVVTGVLSNCS